MKVNREEKERNVKQSDGAGNKMKEKYSVLMSVYYKEQPEYLKEAIDSMILQTLSPDDFVIVCDGPLTKELDDVIEQYVKEYPDLFQIVRLSENKGLGLALANGLLHCKNEIVARMDSDDISVPKRMELQMKAIMADETISVAGGQISEFQGSTDNIVSYRIVPCTEEEIRKTLPFRSPLNHVTAVFRKTHILEAGNYRDLHGYEDYYLWASLVANGNKLINIKDVVCNVRIDDALYQRRGGWKYFIHAVELQNLMRKMGLLTNLQYIRNLVVRFAGSVLLPNKIRGFLYKIVMRKKDCK